MSTEVPDGWTCEVRLLNCCTGETKTVTIAEYEGATDVILKLAMINACFELDGIRYWGEKPVVDPIHKIVYYRCEGHPVT